MKKPNVVLGESGRGDEDMAASHRFLALVTDNWINDNGCIGQAELAQSLGKPMIAFIKMGTKNLKAIDRFQWTKKYVYCNQQELEACMFEVLRQ